MTAAENKKKLQCMFNQSPFISQPTPVGDRRETFGDGSAFLYSCPRMHLSSSVERHVAHALLEGPDAAKSSGLSQNNPAQQVRLVGMEDDEMLRA